MAQSYDKIWKTRQADIVNAILDKKGLLILSS